jgi:hypothetical protein
MTRSNDTPKAVRLAHRRLGFPGLRVEPERRARGGRWLPVACDCRWRSNSGANPLVASDSSSVTAGHDSGVGERDDVRAARARAQPAAKEAQPKASSRTAQQGFGFHGSGSDCGVSVTTPGGGVELGATVVVEEPDDGRDVVGPRWLAAGTVPRARKWWICWAA